MEEGRTIPTCSRAFPPLIAGALLLAAAPAAANVEEPRPLTAFARALAAESLADADEAARRYAAALTLAPENELLARRALTAAMDAGDRTLALRAARALQGATTGAADVRLLLLTDAFERRDWKEAALHIDRIEEDEAFAFFAPLLRLWVAADSGKGNVRAMLAALPKEGLAASYGEEHRPFLLLASRSGRKEGVAALAPLMIDPSPRAERLRIAAAALLARQGKRGDALALLDGSAPALAAARAEVGAGRPLGGGLGTAGAGVADLLVKFAEDIAGPDVPELAIRFAQLASFFDPGSADARILTGRLLAEQGQHRAALRALAQVRAEDPLAARAAEARTASLIALGRGEEALAAATAGAASAEGAARLGDVLTELGRHDEAAAAYGKALKLAQGSAPSARANWALALQLGSALLAADRWPEAKAALQEAQRLAPDQAMVLNFLGYAQLERRENLAEAARLIEEANRLAPGDAAITDSLGWAHYVRGDVPKAIELLERAAQAVPADPAVNEHLGDAYYSAGRRFEARFAWQAALIFAAGEAAERIEAKMKGGLKPGLAAP